MRLRRSDPGNANAVDGYEHDSYTFTSDGQAVISGGDNGRLIAYDLTGKRIGEYDGHEGEVWAVAASDDGRFIVSGGVDKAIWSWNAKTRELLVTLFDRSPAQLQQTGRVIACAARFRKGMLSDTPAE